jgi:hypothetical protein
MKPVAEPQRQIYRSTAVWWISNTAAYCATASPCRWARRRSTSCWCCWRAAGAKFYQEAADFYLRSRNLWAATGKAIPRRLREVDADFAARCCAAFDELFAAKRADAVIVLAEEMLAPHGGFLFDGYADDAPATSRIPLGEEAD